MAADVTIDPALIFAPDPSISAWLTIAPVALMLLSGGLLATIRRRIDWHAPLAIASLVILCLITSTLFFHILKWGPITMALGRWWPPFGIALTVDLLGATFALTSSVIVLLISIHALFDIDRDHRRYGFFPFLMFLMAGVNGAFLTGDIFNLYVWFEVLLISSFGLLVLGGERQQIDGTVKYGLLNLVGTTLFLIATGYLYALFGTLNMADIAMKVRDAKQDLPLGTLCTLYLVAFGMKAAAFPLNAWLPASYHTPRLTVSALFATVMTKVGVYALLRVLVMLMPGEREALSPVIATIAGFTMLVGSLSAIGCSDLRRMIGHWVITGIGVMLAGLAIGSADALSATIFYMLHSMVVMAALYLAGGVIARACSGWDLARLGGLYGKMPVFSMIFFGLLLALSGLPPFSGFWPKAMLVKAGFATGHPWLAAIVLLSGFLLTFAAARVFLFAVWRPAADPTPASRPDRISPGLVAIFAAISLAAGLWPQPFADVSHIAAQGLLDPQSYIGTVLKGVGP